MRERCAHIIHKALAAVRPQFRLDLADGIHGLPHWSRVWCHGGELADALDVDPAVVACYAAVRFATGLRRSGAPTLCE